MSKPRGSETTGRELVRLHFTAKREMFVHSRDSKDGGKRKQQTQLQKRSAADDIGSAYLRSIRDSKDLYLHKHEVDIGVDATLQKTTCATQTAFYRRVNAAVQVEPPVVDARMQAVGGGKEGSADGLVEQQLKKFFDKVMPRMQHHLTQSTEVPLFIDDFAALTEEDAFVGAREENFLREAGNFFHAYTRERQVTAIDWIPGTRSVVLSTIAPVPLSDRLENTRACESSVCVVWNFDEQTNPRCVLEAPGEVYCLKVHPSTKNTDSVVVVGGLFNGQVVMWDLKKAPDSRAARQVATRRTQNAAQQAELQAIPEMPRLPKGLTGERIGDHTVWRLQPIYASRIESSHKRAVHDICWLPENAQLGHDGRLMPIPSTLVGPTQFATVSEDGCMNIWSLDPDDLPDDRKRNLRNATRTATKDPKSSAAAGGPMDANLPNRGAANKVWVPIKTFSLTRPDGSGNVLGLRVHIDPAGGYQMVCTSVEGEFCVCYWGPKDDKAPNQAFDDGSAKREAKLVRTLSLAHTGPAWGLHRHPQLPDYFLTAGDWGFKIWRAGLPAPIVSSPRDEQQIMCARWSPTRAAVIFTGTKDGYVQVWDLLDRSHEPVLNHAVNKEAITCIEFRSVDKRSIRGPQYVALGTTAGSFHRFELPHVLVHGQSSELRQTKIFFERERRRVEYFSWRWKERQKEMDRLLQEKTGAGPGAAGGAPGKAKEEGEAAERSTADDEAEYVMDAEADREFLDLVEKLATDAEESA